MEEHLYEELLPFWLDRLWDKEWGGFLTQWDKDGKDSGVDEKSLLAHMRTIYSLSLAAMHGHDRDGRCKDLADRGVQFAIDNYWDEVYGGFYWLFDRKGTVLINKKIVYGLSFAIYALSSYTKAFDNPIGLEYAEKCFDLLQKYGAETSYGGYWEMFERDWTLCGPGAEGGDRKTLDVHMHLMEAFTALYGASGKDIHRRKLLEIIDLIDTRILHPEYKTGIPQFFVDWSVAPQIKFNVIWGWDRFEGEEGEKANALDNTSYGHNVEFFWLLSDALRTLAVDRSQYDPMFEKLLTHAVTYGVDRTHGGVFVEGSLDGSAVYDRSKEFWQQAEFLVGMLDAYLAYGDEKYLEVYENVHRFVFDKMINHEVGEWLALLEEDGKPIWSHMSHSWKVNYHTIRSVVLSLDRMDRILNRV
jgi:mannose/cellobiose epimerase-like protein (N-acyl-D-glucosamine 2-epimerase family)